MNSKVQDFNLWKKSLLFLRAMFWLSLVLLDSRFGLDEVKYTVLG